MRRIDMKRRKRSNVDIEKRVERRKEIGLRNEDKKDRIIVVKKIEEENEEIGINEKKDKDRFEGIEGGVCEIRVKIGIE